MQITPLQQYCLEEMEIERYHYHGAQEKKYLIIYQEAAVRQEQDAQKTLLDNIIKALNWPEELITQITINDPSELVGHVQRWQKKHDVFLCNLCFVESVYRMDGIALEKTIMLPSLGTIRATPSLKRTVWERIKPYKMM